MIIMLGENDRRLATQSQHGKHDQTMIRGPVDVYYIVSTFTQNIAQVGGCSWQALQFAGVILCVYLDPCNGACNTVESALCRYGNGDIVIAIESGDQPAYVRGMAPDAGAGVKVGIQYFHVLAGVPG